MLSAIVVSELRVAKQFARSRNTAKLLAGVGVTNEGVFVQFKTLRAKGSLR